jgi:2-succinyl-5-enolpyruvyl-6-hydroxy-3-cyclohexene-1-carboxylate synthase
MSKIANRNTFWAHTLVEELLRGGLAAVVIAPGSRSTPLALAFGSQPGFSVYLHHDERGAAFFALGLALASGKPAAVLCTSGTAAVNFYPAVVEAHQSNIPLLVLTADRSPELRHSGSNQTIDQVKLYGDYVRWVVEVSVPVASPPDHLVRSLRSLANRALSIAQGLPPGPVHLNLPFSKPLEPIPLQGDIPSSYWEDRGGFRHARSNATPFVKIVHGRVFPTPAQVQDFSQAIQTARRGLIYCGPRCPRDIFPECVYRLSAATGFPILADALSGLRFHPGVPVDRVLGGYETFLKDKTIGKQLDPDLLIQFGGTPTSKSMGDYLAGLTSTRRLQVNGQGAWSDDSFTTSDYFWADENSMILEAVDRLDIARKPETDPQWLTDWQRAEQCSWQAVEEARAEVFFEGSILADVLDELAQGDSLFVASSLPVRHLDQFGKPASKELHLYANRGASGIDGTIASAAGVAAANPNRRLALVIGDLAFLHDLNSLLLLHKYSLNVTIVLINNDGGGIFRRLPIANYEPFFSQYFLAPHGLEFEGAARLFQLGYHRLAEPQAFRPVFRQALETGGPQIIEVPTDSAFHEAARARIGQYFDLLWTVK